MNNPILRGFMSRFIRANMARRNRTFEDGLYAGLCGTGSPLPDPRRTGPCIAVLAGQRLFIVDAGEGSTRNLLLMNLPIAKAEAVLLTHYHSDHIADLGEMLLQRWVTGSNTAPLDVIGPLGVEQVVQGFNQAYQLDAGYRVAHHGPVIAPPTGAGGTARPFELSNAADASALVYDRDGVRITAFKVDHRPVDPAVGYRFDYKGRSVVVSGDTIYSESLVKHAKGADLLFHEALNAAMIRLVNENAAHAPSPAAARVTNDIPSYHSTPEDAARAAAGAGARQLVLYHIIPPLPSPILKGLFLGDSAKFYSGPITMGEDGMLFSLPPESHSIQMRRLLK